MKVGILTYHFADNYGAVLQAKATKTFVESIGHDVEIVNYATDYMHNNYEINPLKKSKRRIVESCIELLNRKNQYINFDEFRKNELNVQNRYRVRNVNDLSMNYDAVICGSDQVWNLNLSGMDETYFLNYLPDDVKKIGYAISIGKNDNSIKFTELVKKYAVRFKSLSFREEVAADYIGELIKNKYDTVVDPVFLLDSEKWISMSRKPKSVKYNEDYILLYQLENNEELVNKAVELSRKEGIPIRAIHPTCCKVNKKISMLKDVGPREFLWLIANAKYICTNSFHGMAFSILFKKKMVCAAHKTLGDRNRQLLNILTVKESVDLIDFSNVDDENLRNLIGFSKKWLENNINN